MQSCRLARQHQAKPDSYRDDIEKMRTTSDTEENSRRLVACTKQHRPAFFVLLFIGGIGFVLAIAGGIADPRGGLFYSGEFLFAGGLLAMLGFMRAVSGVAMKSFSVTFYSQESRPIRFWLSTASLLIAGLGSIILGLCGLLGIDCGLK